METNHVTSASFEREAKFSTGKIGEALGQQVEYHMLHAAMHGYEIARAEIVEEGSDDEWLRFVIRSEKRR